MLGNIAYPQIVCLEPFVFREVDFPNILPGVSVYYNGDSGIDDKRVAGLLVGLEYKIDESYQEKYPNLKVVASATTGVDHIVLPNTVKLIKLESHEVKAVSATSEFAFGLLISLVRKIPFSIHNPDNREVLQGIQLQGKTLGIIGFGRLGQNMAQYAKAFLMNVITFDKADNRSKLYQLLNESDIISIHLPLSAETTGLIGLKEFQMMGKKPFVINTSRPPIISKEALLTAVKEEYIKGIAMDFQNYDCSKDIDQDLSSLPDDKVIFTPHIAGNTIESVKQAATIVINKLAHFISKKGIT